MFKNLTIYRLPVSTAAALLAAAHPIDSDTYPLADSLGIEQLRPIGPMELHAAGWISPYGSGDDRLFQQVGDCIMLTLGGESKVLPPSAVAAATSKRVADIEAQTGNTLGRRARQRVKDEIVTDMLPRAFTAPSRLSGYLDLSRGILAVDTASRKAADEFVGHLRKTRGSFPALPLNAEVAPRDVLTKWVEWVNAMPASFKMAGDCEFRESTEDGAMWRGKSDDMRGAAVIAQLESSRQCTRLALEHHDRLLFTFGDDLVIRKLRFLVKLDTDHDDAIAESDARLALLAGEVGALFDVLADAFKFSVAE